MESFKKTSVVRYAAFRIPSANGAHTILVNDSATESTEPALGSARPACVFRPIPVHQFRWYPFSPLVIFSIVGKVNIFFSGSLLKEKISLLYARFCQGRPLQSAHFGTRCTSPRLATDLQGLLPFGCIGHLWFAQNRVATALPVSSILVLPKYACLC